MNVLFKKLHPRAQAPIYATPGAAAFDICTIYPLFVQPAQSAIAQTGLAFEIPEGHVMRVYSRSGHGFKNNVRLSNAVGVIDSDYRGEVMVSLHNDGTSTLNLPAGSRIAQCIIEPVPRCTFGEVVELSETERGANGFGSTGT